MNISYSFHFSKQPFQFLSFRKMSILKIQMCLCNASYTENNNCLVFSAGFLKESNFLETIFHWTLIWAWKLGNMPFACNNLNDYQTIYTCFWQLWQVLHVNYNDQCERQISYVFHTSPKIPTSINIAQNLSPIKFHAQLGPRFLWIINHKIPLCSGSCIFERLAVGGWSQISCSISCIRSRTYLIASTALAHALPQYIVLHDDYI